MPKSAVTNLISLLKCDRYVGSTVNFQVLPPLSQTLSMSSSPVMIDPKRFRKCSMWMCVCVCVFVSIHAGVLPWCCCWTLVWQPAVPTAAGSSVWPPAPAPWPNAASPRELETSEGGWLRGDKVDDVASKLYHTHWQKVKACENEVWNCRHTLLGCGAAAADPFSFPLTVLLPKISSIWKQGKTIKSPRLQSYGNFIPIFHNKIKHLCQRIDLSPGGYC